MLTRRVNRRLLIAGLHNAILDHMTITPILLLLLLSEYLFIDHHLAQRRLLVHAIDDVFAEAWCILDLPLTITNLLLTILNLTGTIEVLIFSLIFASLFFTIVELHVFVDNLVVIYWMDQTDHFFGFVSWTLHSNILCRINTAMTLCDWCLLNPYWVPGLTLVHRRLLIMTLWCRQVAHFRYFQDVRLDLWAHCSLFNKSKSSSRFDRGRLLCDEVRLYLWICRGLRNHSRNSFILITVPILVLNNDTIRLLLGKTTDTLVNQIAFSSFNLNIDLLFHNWLRRNLLNHSQFCILAHSLMLIAHLDNGGLLVFGFIDLACFHRLGVLCFFFVILKAWLRLEIYTALLRVSID